MSKLDDLMQDIESRTIKCREEFVHQSVVYRHELVQKLRKARDRRLARNINQHFGGISQ